MKTGHAIPLTPQKRLMVFAGRSHPALASKIVERLGVELGEIELTTFANGETYCRYCESIRGADVFIVQTGCRPVDQNIMELLFMIQAAKLASAKRITAVIPWFPYSRQDRKAKPREPISSRLLADMIQGAGADRVLTMDLACGPDPGLLHDSRRPHDRTATLRAALPRPRVERRGRRVGRTGCGASEVRGPLRRDDRGRLRDHEQDPPRPGCGLGDRGHRSCPRQGLHRRRRRHRRRAAPSRRGARTTRARREGGVALRHARAPQRGGARVDSEAPRTSPGSSSPTPCRSTPRSSRTTSPF